MSNTVALAALPAPTGGLYIPTLDEVVPARFSKDLQRSQTLARFAKAAECAGVPLPSGNFLTIEQVVAEQWTQFLATNYQLGIFERKLARGQQVEDILAVNAAPGFSEHHSGLALDIGAPDEPPAEASFERTPAFEWLGERAGDHGLAMSYPRDNPHGIVYEPWHWRFSPT